LFLSRVFGVIPHDVCVTLVCVIDDDDDDDADRRESEV
jgi:hypothetical protein